MGVGAGAGHITLNNAGYKLAEVLQYTKHLFLQGAPLSDM